MIVQDEFTKLEDISRPIQAHTDHLVLEVSVIGICLIKLITFIFSCCHLLDGSSIHFLTVSESVNDSFFFPHIHATRNIIVHKKL